MNDFYDRIVNILTKSQRTFYRHGETHRSYRDAYHYICKLRHRLADIQNKPIGIYAGKSFETYASILGILLSGNSWVALSRETPLERLQKMCKLADIRALLVDNTAPVELLDFASSHEMEVISFEEVHGTYSNSQLEAPRVDSNSNALIYFTSGSTGEPKGVRLTHQNYIAVVSNIMDALPLRVGEVFADYHDTAFVISVPIIFPCILSESAIAPALRGDEVLLPHKHMVGNDVSVLITVPSTLARLRKSKVSVAMDSPLNILILCGEPLHLDILKYCLEDVRPLHTYNFYGSTEVAPWTFHHECKENDLTAFKGLGYMPIGRPLPGIAVRLDHETSELLVSGDNVTPGYLGDLHSDRFEILDGTRWYRTGDIATEYDDVYVCKGRIDSQIKIDGYRVELMDLEANLRAIKNVNGAICFTSGEGTDKIIVAVLHTEEVYNAPMVRRWLGQTLPGYMLPRKVVCLKNVPLNKSGKIDRHSLKEKYE